MQRRKANTHTVAQMQTGVSNTGQVSMANSRNGGEGEGEEELRRRKLAFIMVTFTAEIPELLPHMSKQNHSVCCGWLGILQCVTRRLNLCVLRHTDNCLCWKHS